MTNIDESIPNVEPVRRRIAFLNDAGERVEEEIGEGVFKFTGTVIPFPGATPQPEALHDDDLTSHVRQLHDAAKPFVGAGKLRLSASFPKKNSRAKFQHFRIGDVDSMVAAIKAFKDSGKNISLPWLVVHRDAPMAALKETDVLAALAIVTDPGNPKGDKYRLNELGAEASATLQIGTTQHRNIYLLSRPVMRETEPAFYRLIADASFDSVIPDTFYHSKATDTVQSLNPMPVKAIQPFNSARLDVDAVAKQLPSDAELVDVNLRPPTNRPSNEEWTELGNARRLVRRFGADIRYCWPLKAWFIFDGIHWCRDDGARILQLAQQTIEALHDEARAIPEEATRTAVRKFALACQTRKHLIAVAGLAQQFPEVILPFDKLDADPLLLGVLNGTIDLRAGEFRPGRREDCITKRCNIVFDPHAKCLNWLEFENKIAGEGEYWNLVAYKQRVFGLCLSGEVPEILFICHGEGSNGKTTELETIHAILGDYAHACDASLLISVKDQSGPTPEIVALKGKRGVFINETDAKDWFNEARVKYLTGKDILYGRGLHQDPINFTPTHKPILRTNHKPKIRGTDLGMWRRIHYLPYTVTIPDDEDNKNFREEMLVPEHAGIFNWMLAGWLAYLADRRKLRPPQRVQEAKEAYRAAMDITGRWIALAIETALEEKVLLKTIYEAYSKWYADEIGAVGAISTQTLSAELQKRGFERRSGHAGATIFEHLKLKTGFDDLTIAPELPPRAPVNPFGPVTNPFWPKAEETPPPPSDEMPKAAGLGDSVSANKVKTEDSE
jgi:putative DNA primase/helicase